MKLEHLEKFANIMGTNVHPRLGAELALLARRGHLNWLKANSGERALSEEGKYHKNRVASITTKIVREVDRDTLSPSIMWRLSI